MTTLITGWNSLGSAAQTVRIESAAPDKIVASSHAERFVVALMLDAIDAATEFFTERRVLFDAAGHSAMVQTLIANQLCAVH